MGHEIIFGRFNKMNNIGMLKLFKNRSPNF